MDTIEVPFQGHTRTFDSDRLATAILVFHQVRGRRGATRHPVMADAKLTAHLLRTEHSFDTDAIVYAVGAKNAVEMGIEP